MMDQHHEEEKCIAACVRALSKVPARRRPHVFAYVQSLVQDYQDEPQAENPNQLKLPAGEEDAAL